MRKKYQDIFGRRQDGKWQIYWMEQEGDSYRSVSGQYDEISQKPVETSLVQSGWRRAEPTNIGRSNMRTAEQQAEFEIDVQYRSKFEDKYVLNIGDKPIDRIVPMHAEKWPEQQKLVEKKLNNHEVFFSQPKLDGIRAIITKDGVFSRNWKPIVAVPHIHQQLKKWLDAGWIFDGELYNHDLKHDFNKIISLTRKTKLQNTDFEDSKRMIQYWVFDMIMPEGWLFDSRWNFVKNLEEIPHIVPVPTVPCYTRDEIDALYTSYIEDGFEGQMIRFDTNYEHRRSKNLLKRKEFEDREYQVVSIEEGSGNWGGYAKTVNCTDGEKNFGATLKNNQAYCKTVLQNKDKYVGGEVTVRFQNLTPDGIPRFPIAVALYEGKRDL